MEDNQLIAGEACVDIYEALTLQYYKFLDRNGASELTAIQTCTEIASRLDVQSCFKEEYGPIPQETLALAQRFLLEYGPRYWANDPFHVGKFEHAISKPENNDLPEHTKAELRQLNELLTSRLNTKNVDNWSMEEKHQVLSLALSTFDVMANDKRWTLKIKIAL